MRVNGESMKNHAMFMQNLAEKLREKVLEIFHFDLDLSKNEC